MIDLKDLEAFLTILDSGSISKAAEDLGLTQPAISLKLKKMEAELGVKLFQRTPRNVVALESARIIEPRIRDILSQFDGVKESLAASIKEVKGHVRMGCVVGWLHPLLEPALVRLNEVAPNLRLRITVDQTPNLLFALQHGRLDYAIVAQPFESVDGLMARHLLDEELVLVGKNLPDKGSQLERKRALLARPWICLDVPDKLVAKYWKEHFKTDEEFPWDKVNVPVCVTHILELPGIIARFPDAVGVVPRQIIPDSLGLDMAEAIPERNGLYLVWRTDGLELQRYQVTKKVILEQAESYSQSRQKTRLKP